ncbi:MAG TPA: response regulator [Blastocatellia bacterium]|nr:response regulator [Blastocatellia bacterium]
MTERIAAKNTVVNERQTILVIDDDPDWTDLLRAYFLDKYHVKVANSAFEAVKMAQNDRPVLMIIDLIMPGMDGFGVIRRLEDSIQAQIPTILLTGWKCAEVEECASAFESVTVMGKPVSLMALDATVSAQLRKNSEARTS